jgi:glutathione peroxidase-family protein
MGFVPDVKEHSLLFTVENPFFCHLKKKWQKSCCAEYVIWNFSGFLIRNGKKEQNRQ